MNQQELQEKERLLEEKEQELNRREKQLDAFSAAMDAKKKQLYGKLPITVKQVDIILWISCGLLALVVVLIILEATGIFKSGYGWGCLLREAASFLMPLRSRCGYMSSRTRPVSFPCVNHGLIVPQRSPRNRVAR